MKKIRQLLGYILLSGVPPSLKMSLQELICELGLRSNPKTHGRWLANELEASHMIPRIISDSVKIQNHAACHENQSSNPEIGDPTDSTNEYWSAMTKGKEGLD